jgi:hypothetical protein
MSFDALNEAIARGGGTWVNLKAKGDRIEGTIIDFEERPKTFEGEPVLSRKTGKPRFEWVFTLQTGESDGPDDDGVRKVALDEWGRGEFKDAVKKSGAAAEAGGLLVLAIVEDRKSPTDSVQQHLRARYTPPAKSLGIPAEDDF